MIVAQGIAPRQRFVGGTDYRACMYRAQAHSYLDARRRPFIHLVDGGLADNLGVRRLLDRALAGGGLRKSHLADGTDAFAPDAEIDLVVVNLRDAPVGEVRRELLQTPTAFSISGGEVTQLITAGRDILRRSLEFQALLRSLGARAD